MYNLRITVERVLGFCDSPMQVGDYFEVHSNKLYIPTGKNICIWALQSMMPFFPAKQRVVLPANDWIPHTDHFSCPDPNGQVIFRIDLLDPKSNKVISLMEDKQMKVKRLVTDTSKCTGCRSCEMACSFKHTNTFSSELSRIRVVKDEKNGIDSPIVCHQCGHAPCINICPASALTKDPQTQAIIVDKSLCTGCQICLSVCSFNSINFNEDSIEPLICDLCDGSPSCVKSCSVNAIKFE